MRRVFLVVAILLVAGVALYFLSAARRPGTSPTESSTAASSLGAGQNSATSQNTDPATPSTVNSSATSSAAAPPASPAAQAGQLIPASDQVADLPPATVLANVRHAIRQYGEMFGGDPVGTNPEITRQLLGDNPRHINFIDPSAGMRVNADGELVDAWGTPYFFHQLSGSDMEIHSAGPDKIMWTSDDIVIK
jgi:hypothetical protein